MKKPLDFNQLMKDLHSIPLAEQEAWVLNVVNETLSTLETPAIYEYIAIIHREMPGYSNHPLVVAMLEMLEGMIALRRMGYG